MTADPTRGLERILLDDLQRGERFSGQIVVRVDA
jgi:hypothetical protein